MSCSQTYVATNAFWKFWSHSYEATQQTTKMNHVWVCVGRSLAVCGLVREEIRPFDVRVTSSDVQSTSSDVRVTYE